MKDYEEIILLLEPYISRDVTQSIIIKMLFKHCYICGDYKQEHQLLFCNTDRLCFNCASVMFKCELCSLYNVIEHNHYCFKCEGNCRFFCDACDNT